MYSCSDFLLGGTGFYTSRETSTWVQVQPPESTRCKLLPELKKKEMTWRKWCGTSFHQCALVISWKTPKQNSHNGNEVDLVTTLTEKNAFPFGGGGAF